MPTTEKASSLGIDIPAGWTLPARAMDWQRQCLADRQWCTVFKALFRLKTGINLDELEEILFPSTSPPGPLGHLLQLFSSTVRLTLFYVLLAATVLGLAIGGHLAFQGAQEYFAKKQFNNNNKNGGKVYRQGSLGSSSANYHRLRSVKVENND
ncbi:hypothetical protein TYRP_021778 [Tyrophagus putrescentiae]|nr:hypothetical protein TYRP_021778 [Tyrophagus putrescentiae]